MRSTLADPAASSPDDTMRPPVSSPRFTIHGCLGSGGMGAVWEAEDHERGFRVALKLLDPTRFKTPEALYHLKQEFRALAGVSHPNLIQLYDLFVEDEQAFFTMEYIEGNTFMEHSALETILPTEDASEVPTNPLPRLDEDLIRDGILQLTRALHHLHQTERLHLDIKPSNVMVDHGGRIVIIDFGVSIGKGRQGNSQYGGTPVFMSPEQARREKLTPASDWYSLGALLYVTLTRKIPFVTADHNILALKKGPHDNPPLPSTLVPDVPKDLEALCMDLLHQDPAMRPSGPEILQRLQASAPAEPQHPHASSLFVGRHKELTHLIDAIEGLTQSGSRKILLEGPSGIGKSSILQQFLHHASELPNTLFTTGQCYERENIPFRALDTQIDLLSEYWSQLPEEKAKQLIPEDASGLLRLFPVLRRVPVLSKIAPADLDDPQLLRTRAFQSFADLLQRLCQKRTLVIVIDDVQWIDADSIALLQEVFQKTRELPILIVLASRPISTQNNHLLDKILSTPGSRIEHLQISGLPRKDCETLAHHHVHEHDERAIAVHQMAQESGGNPFLLKEFARHLAANPGVQARTVNLKLALATRIQSLTPDQKRLLNLVCIANAPLPSEILSQAAHTPPDLLLRDGDLLRNADFLRSVASHPNSWVPYHDRIREAALAQLSEPEIQQKHQTIAQLLELHEENPAQIAYHWSEAGQKHRAAHFAHKAAREALARLDFDIASRLLQTTLELGHHTPKEKHHLHMERANALANAGRSSEAAALLTDLSETIPPEDSFHLRCRAAEHWMLSGDLQRGINTMEGLLAEIGEHYPTSWAVPFSMAKGILWTRTTSKIRWTPSPNVPELLQKRARVYQALSTSLALADIALATHYLFRLLDVSRRLPSPLVLSRALASCSIFYTVTGDLQRGRKFLEDSCKLVEGIEAPQIKAYQQCVRSLQVLYNNDIPGALQYTREGLRQMRSTRLQLAEHNQVSIFVPIYLSYLGDIRALASAASAAIADAQRRGDLFQEVSLRTRCVLIHLAKDNPEAASNDIQSALDLWPKAPPLTNQSLWGIFARCEIALYTQNPDEALSLIEQNYKLMDSSGALRVTMTRVELLFLQGRVAMMRAPKAKKRSKTISELKSLASKLKSGSNPFLPGLGDLFLAASLLFRRNRKAALQHLREAQAFFEKACMSLHAACVRYKIGELYNHPDIQQRATKTLYELGIQNPAQMAYALVPLGDPAPLNSTRTTGSEPNT